MSVLTNLSKGGHKDPERDDEGDLNALEVDVEDLVLVLGVPLVYRLVVPKARVADMVLGEGRIRYCQNYLVFSLLRLYCNKTI